MIGKTISHYKILEKLGEGGMGVVYKAEDTKLKREVAIKFLPRRIDVSDEERQRFKLEAQAAAALNHNNIATVHEIDEVGDDEFIVMEIIKGESLKEKIAKGPIKLDEAMRIATEVADGLHEAHEHKIVHRDIKPANIMLTAKGQCKIMDFGLAKMAQATLVTKEGTTLGTAAYMSPEQAQGAVVDQRTDIWALGAVIYEMITGQQPFRGDYEQAVTYSIMNEAPEPLTALRTGVPRELERIVLKALAKEPGERYQHADEMLVDLKAVARTETQTLTGLKTRPAFGKGSILIAGFALAVLLATVAAFLFNSADFGPVTTERTIAVLPFDNLNKDDETDYFSDGITEDITMQLSKIGALSVTSRTSAMGYKGSRKSLSEVGQELGVGYILEGSVRRDRNRVRVVAQLIDTREDKHLWAESYDRQLTDIFAIQSDLAQQIAAALRATLVPEEKRLLSQKPTDNLEAYQKYLQGRFFWNKRTPPDIRRAISYFEEAIAIDSLYALGYAGLAQCYIVLAGNGWEMPEKAYPRAQALCEKALRLNADLAEGYASLGAILSEWKWDYPAAEEAFQKAIQLNPNYATAYQWLAEVYLITGRYDLATNEIEKAKQLDPHALILKVAENEINLAQRRFREAIALSETVLSANRDFNISRFQLSYALMCVGDYERALVENKKLNVKINQIWIEARVLALRGQTKEARSRLQELLALAKSEYVDPSLIAYLYGDIGQLDEAFYWLDRAVQERSIILRGRHPYPPPNNIQRDPRYLVLLHKAGLD